MHGATCAECGARERAAVAVTLSIRLQRRAAVPIVAGELRRGEQDAHSAAGLGAVTVGAIAESPRRERADWVFRVACEVFE